MEKKLIYDIHDKPKFGQMLIFALQQVLAILGCDFDGMGIHTEDGENVSSIPSLLREMRSSGMGSSLCEKIIFKNAYDFLMRSL